MPLWITSCLLVCCLRFVYYVFQQLSSRKLLGSCVGYRINIMLPISALMHTICVVRLHRWSWESATHCPCLRCPGRAVISESLLKHSISLLIIDFGDLLLDRHHVSPYWPLLACVYFKIWHALMYSFPASNIDQSVLNRLSTFWVTP